MIPDFKTYIKESVWGDILDRGTGKLRKEDDVDLLDPREFFEFLRYNYSIKKNTFASIEAWGHKIDSITVPIICKNENVCYVLSYYINVNSIKFPYDISNTCPDLFEKLKKNFHVTIFTTPSGNPETCKITDKNNKSSKSVYVDILDFIIDNANTDKLTVEREYDT